MQIDQVIEARRNYPSKLLLIFLSHQFKPRLIFFQ
ncbi:unnamed protein product [Spirodela intermedia]|uniref:Uncharacterized protein n=2 Tax=Spirodela intermedia TaxID=51605 RepID=A0A7I8KS36_SPIIN|nr:unnamed protein product [Spirodela intermedia]CAA6663638.1 unnamed protein product [Spirodela intermedia]CAA7400126.1 unnamed protein product [Spirodela intermedia]